MRSRLCSKNSVPGSRFGDWFDDCVRSMQFGPDRLHHPISANRTFPIRRRIGRFCGDFRPLNSRIWSLWAVGAFWRRSLAPCLRIQKFRSRRAGLSTKFDRICARNSDFWAAVIRGLGPALQLFRIESERLKLSAPFNRLIAGSPGLFVGSSLLLSGFPLQAARFPLVIFVLY